jgi:holo-[acyl-carrier protein] synthase
VAARKNFDLGVDIEEVSRFRNLVRNKRFLERVYTPREVAYCRDKKNQLQHFAVRFAAKEAVWKCLSETLHRLKKKLGHRDIGIRNSPSGKPEISLPPSLRQIEKRIHVSLSHSSSHVVAVAILSNE